MDAALLNSQGRGRFRELQKNYGGLLKQADTANTAARAQGQAASDAVDKKAQLAKDKLDFYGKEEERKRIEKQVLDDKAKDAAAKKAGKPNYDAYTTGHEAENTLKDISSAMNPIDWWLMATGQPTMTDRITPRVEGAVNKYAGSELNSHRVRFANMNIPDADKRLVFDSLTNEELSALEGMTGAQQEAWVAQRLKELKG